MNLASQFTGDYNWRCNGFNENSTFTMKGVNYMLVPHLVSFDWSIRLHWKVAVFTLIPKSDGRKVSYDGPISVGVLS